MKQTAIYLGHASAGPYSARVETILRETYDLVFVQHFDFADRDHFDQQLLCKWRADFLFSFGPLIVKPPVLDSVRIAAINFHPAPPKWPGRGSRSMALLNGDTDFGVTAHIMHTEVDAGPILRVIRFPIAQEDDAETLRHKAFRYIPELVGLLISDLRQNGWQPQPNGEIWERKAIRKKDAMEIIRISKTDNEETVRRKTKASADIGSASGVTQNQSVRNCLTAPDRLLGIA